MIRFEKVTAEQYVEDRRKRSSSVPDGPSLLQEYASISMPKRSTRYSAGYDIRTPFGFALWPGQSLVVPTGLRAVMEPDMWLGLYIRSSLGFKYGIRLVNSTAVIDADYAGAANQGHLMVGIYNGGQKVLRLEAGDAFAQGIFQKYYITDDDAPKDRVRIGGFGSTNG